MLPSPSKEQKTNCHVNSHVTSIRYIRGMSLAQLASNPEYIKVTSSRHDLPNIPDSDKLQLKQCDKEYSKRSFLRLILAKAWLTLTSKRHTLNDIRRTLCCYVCSVNILTRSGGGGPRVSSSPSLIVG